MRPRRLTHWKYGGPDTIRTCDLRLRSEHIGIRWLGSVHLIYLHQQDLGDLAITITPMLVAMRLLLA